jgi:hypothetical protein
VTATEVLDCKQSAASARAKKSGQGKLFKMMTGVKMVYMPYWRCVRIPDLLSGLGPGRGFFHPRRCSDPLWRLPRLTDGACGRFSKAGLRLSIGCESFSATLLQAMMPL